MTVVRKAISVLAVGVAVLGGAGVVTACSTDGYQGICEDTATGQRVDDGRCPDSGGTAAGAAFAWIYFRSGQTAPAVGARVTGGVRTPPEGSSVSRGGVSSSGGALSGDDEGGSGGSGDDDGGSGGSSGGDDDGGSSGGGFSGGGEE